uniref:Uncharacterized protein n=1 Tax=Amorphochlora amoebiformis TaxID=1561963 RepID=A0A7S0D826_9EUKA|mmetsp:Transcript_21311/g.33629  ORF Transcript_21311/g.33629 Transcript_21311/m.33629 type:complete len:473 (+) Transcript_21311:30-1448(+)
MDVFLNVKKPRKVWFPETISGLYPLGKAEIGEDVYALNASIRSANAAASSSAPDGTQGGLKPGHNKKLAQRVAREEEIRQMKHRIHVLEGYVSSQRAALARIQTEIKRHREAIGRTEYEIESAEEEQKSLEENYQSLKEDYTQSIKSSKHNRQSYDKNIREIREQLQNDTQLPPEVFGSVEEIMKLKQEIQRKQDRLQELRAGLKGTTRQQTMMQDVLLKQNTNPSSTMTHQVVEYARNNANQFETFKLKLRDSIDKKKKAKQDLDRRKREILSLQEDIAKQSKLNAELKQKDKKKNMEAHAQKERVEELKAKVKELEDRQAKREEELEQIQQQGEVRQRMLEEIDRRAEESEEKYVRHMIEIQVFRLGKRNLEETTARLLKKQRLLAKDKKELEEALVRYEAGVSFDKKDKLDDSIAIVKRLYERKTSLSEQINIMEEKCAKKSKDIAALRYCRARNLQINNLSDNMPLGA